jgi:hypothetical protein
MKPHAGKLTFESLGEIDVLNAGLDVLIDVASDGPVSQEARVMRQFSGDLSSVAEEVTRRMANDPTVGDALADAAPSGVDLTFEDPRHVSVARMAVSVVAANAPGTTDSLHLQDLLVYDAAQDMVSEYEAATGHPIYPIVPGQ